MGAFLSLSRVIDRLTAGFGVLAEYFVLFAVVVSGGNAILRYTLGITSNGALEIQWYMFAAIVLFGAAHTLQMNAHVRVDLVYSSISERGRLYVDIVGIILILLPTMAYFFSLTWPFFLRSFLNGETSMNAGGLILWPAKLTLPVGFGLLFLQGISELIKRVAALQGLTALETHYEKPLQ